MTGFLRFMASTGLALIALLLVAPASAFAKNQPARTQTVAAGPYAIDVSLSQDPPFADQPFDVVVRPRVSGLQFKGEVIARPGLGTDAIDLHTPLSPTGDGRGTLKSTIHIPVRGAWNVVVQLEGPQGMGSASIPVTVGAPGAMAPWLAWLIGASPLVLIAVCVWFQHRYRRTLLAQAVAQLPATSH
ncbi:MAG: hypothetical protein NVSMB44_38970 [Ktedonobacteraceae bacterium]